MQKPSMSMESASKFIPALATQYVASVGKKEGKRQSMLLIKLFNGTYSSNSSVRKWSNPQSDMFILRALHVCKELR